MHAHRMELFFSELKNKLILLSNIGVIFSKCIHVLEQNTILFSQIYSEIYHCILFKDTMSTSNLAFHCFMAELTKNVKYIICFRFYKTTTLYTLTEYFFA